MPFSIGLHPYFQIANKEQLQLDIPSRQYIDQLNGATQVFDGRFDYSQDEIDVAFTQLDRDWASGSDRDRQIRIRLDYDPEVYSTVVFWTVKGKDYYCLEPWSAPRNALNTGDRLIRLDAGRRLETGVRLSAEFLSD
jgi:galactose mutarotase-like enzyme